MPTKSSIPLVSPPEAAKGVIRLADASIKALIQMAVATKGRQEVADPDSTGLRLRCASNGHATWSLVCRDPGNRLRRFVLGAYPGLGVAAARKKAASLREQVRSGADPILEKRQKIADHEAARHDADRTLRWLFDEYER